MPRIIVVTDSRHGQTQDERIVFDGDPHAVGDEPSRLARKASQPEEVAGGEEG